MPGDGGDVGPGNFANKVAEHFAATIGECPGFTGSNKERLRVLLATNLEKFIQDNRRTFPYDRLAFRYEEELLGAVTPEEARALDESKRYLETQVAEPLGKMIANTFLRLQGGDKLLGTGSLSGVVGSTFMTYLRHMQIRDNTMDPSQGRGMNQR